MSIVKLYTEEQVRKIAKLYRHELYLLEAAINTEIPIELPTHQEIEKEAFQVPYNGSNEFYDNSFIRGAKWVIEQIEKQK